MDEEKIYDCIVIGAGQSGLACGYYLRRSKLKYLLLDKHTVPGGSWINTWDSLHLFSAAKHNALPGFPMPPSKDEYPTKDEVIDYLKKYESKYSILVERGQCVEQIKREDNVFAIRTTENTFYSKTIISATGTQGSPFIPDVIGRELFEGDQLHSSEYRNPENHLGQHVLIVGDGNSGAQIYAELSKHTLCYWAVKDKPEFLPPDVDGKTLFDQASEIYKARLKGEEVKQTVFNLGNIVQVPEVKEALQNGNMDDFHIMDHLERDGVVWSDGSRDTIDTIIWCTGFNYSTSHLNELLDLDERGRTKTNITKSIDQPGVWLVGYGGWTGMASATIIGVGRTAKRTVKEIESYIRSL